MQLFYPFSLLLSIEDASAPLFLSSLLLSLSLKCISCYRKQQKEEIEFVNQYEKEIENNNCVEIDLLPMEISYTMIGAISSITFYQGDVPSSIIIERLKEILRVNSWLAGRLIKRAGKQLQLLYPKEFSETKLHKHFHVVNIFNYNLPKDQQFSEHYQTQTLLNHVEPYFVKRGYQCINKDEPLFNIIIIKVFDEENQPPNKTAFVMSLCHTIGDGKDFYTIYSFFHPHQSIYPLNPIRDLSFPATIQEMIGKEYSSYPSSSLVLLFRFLISILFESSPICQRYQIHSSLFHRRKQEYYLQNYHQQKKNPLLRTEFISSNDYLSWWFFHQLSSSYGFMAANCRKRIPNLLDEMVGNYLSFIIYSRNDYEESGPFEIRHSLKSLRSSSCRLPSFWETVAIDFKFSGVTNWASFYSTVIFDESCPMVFHSPLIGNKEIGFKDFMIIFRSQEDQLAVLLFSRTKNDPSQWINGIGNEFLEPF